MKLFASWTCPKILAFAFYLVGICLAQNDPIKDFCRRWGHQSAVVDRKLYVDGGLVNYKPFGASSQNLTNTFFLYNDLDSVSEGMPPLHANLSKNATVPSVNGGILWEDSVNKRLYLYGGEYYGISPAEFNLYSYDIIYDNWVSFGPPTGAGQISAASYGAGVSIPARGEAYYYGGWQSNASVPNWEGPPRATNRLLKYDMDSNTWSNLTGPDEIRRAEGSMSFIPIGDAGMLVYFGGSQDLYGNGTLTPQPLDKIFLFDLANTKWYTQKTSGRTPEIRRRFCGGATWAQDQSSYNIYIYGGAGFPPETTGYDDIYILTIPSFQWIRGPYPPGSNITGAFPKSMMSCNVVDNAQMIVIGGEYSNDTTYMCDVDIVGGTHNMNFGEQNPDNAIWAQYQPNLTTYAVPTDILTAVGGRNTGGAIMTKPDGGFDAPDLSVLMTRKATLSTRKPTRSIPQRTSTSKKPSSTSSATDTPSPGLSTGAIAGIAVGSGLIFICTLAVCIFFILRRWKKYTNKNSTAAPPPPPPVSEMPMAYNHNNPASPVSPVGQGPVPNGWDGTQMSSPTMTVMSYDYQQPAWPAVSPAELSSEGGVRQAHGKDGSNNFHRGESPTIAKFELGAGGGNI